MANKPFEIQGSTLTIGGVDLEAGNTGVVIPGVTQATNYKVEEVNDTGDQTYQFAPNSAPVVIDAALYATIVAQGSESGWADFTVTTDDEGYIDEIEVNGQGTYSQSNAGIASSNDMYAYVGAGSASDRPLVPQDWIQVPFRPKMRAGDVETIGGGGSSITNGGESFSIDGDGDVKFDGIGMGGINRGIEWQYGANVNGVNSRIRQDNSGLTVRAWTENSIEGNFSAPVNIVTNQDANQKTWTFDGAGNLTFPDGSIQTTAYTTSTLKTFYLNDYGGINPIEEPIEIVIDGMSYEGGNIVSDGAFGEGSSRVTLYADSMFAMVAVNSTATDVYYNGEMGADSSGQKIKTDLLLDNYRGYYASSCLYSNTGDPCISQIVISKGNSQVTEFHQNPSDTNVDDFHVSGVGSGTVVVLNVYWNSQSDPYNASIQLAAQTFIDTVIFDGGDERTNIALMASAFYTGSAAIRSTIENYEGDLLYSNFDFYEGEQVVRPTGGTGTGFIALVSGLSGQTYNDEFVIKPGTGYSQDDILTVPGSEFGGVSPDNDVTITINGVDGTGSVTNWSIAGTVPSQVWPGSFIIDGDEDQYDTGNFIGTNFTRVTASVTVETVELEANEVTKMTVVSANKDIRIGQFAFFNGQNRGDYIVYADSYGINNTAEYFDSNTGYTSTLDLTYDFAVDVDNAHVTLNGAGSWSIGSNNLNTKIFNTDEIDPEDRDIVIMAGSQNNNWLFRRDGVLELPSGGDILMDGQSVLGGSSAQLVGDGYVAGTGFKRTIYTSYQGYQGGESASLLVSTADGVGITAGDTLTFRNGEVRTVGSVEVNEGSTWIYWDNGVPGDDFNPRYPVIVTSQNYVEDTKKTARIKPDLDTEGSGQYMEVYVGGAMVVDNKHVHMKGHSADTELFLGSDSNFVSAKDAGNSPASVNLKSENDVTVSDTNLRMSRPSNWATIYGDGTNRNFNNSNYDLTWSVIDSDDQGNYYVGGEHADWADAIVAKYGPDGELIWKKFSDHTAIEGWKVDAVAYNPVEKEVAFAVQTNYNRSWDYYKLTIFDSETGDLKSTNDVYDSQGNLNIRSMIWHPTLGYTLAGSTQGETTTTGNINSSEVSYNLTTATTEGSVGYVTITDNGNLPSVVPQAGDKFDFNSQTFTITSVNAQATYYELLVSGNNFGFGAGQPVVLRHSKSGVGVIELPIASVTIGGQLPVGDSNWTISGTNLTGSQQLQGGSIGLYRNCPVINLTNPSATGLEVGIQVIYGSSPSYSNHSTQTAGTGYTFGDSFKILGSYLGGVDGVNDITGTIVDNSNIANGFSGTPAATTWRLDLGWSMGYPSTDFSFGTFQLNTTLNSRAFVWNQSWSRYLNPTNGTSNTYAQSIAFDGDGGGLVVGGQDNSNSYGFIWKLAANGTTTWVKGVDNDTNGVASVAVSKVNGSIYYTTYFNSLNKLNSNGGFVKRVEPSQGAWGYNNPRVKIQQELDGSEYIYVGGSYGAMWSQGGFMLTKMATDLTIVWSRDMSHDETGLYSNYDTSLDNFVLGKDKATLVGYSYAMSPNYYNAIILSISTKDNFETYIEYPWSVRHMGNYITYNDTTEDYLGYNFLTEGATASTGSTEYQTFTDNQTWYNWAYKNIVVNLNATDNGLVGVESIKFTDGGKLDHNPSDISPSATDFYQNGWNYTLKLSDRGRFIINQPAPNNTSSQDLFITVPSNKNVNFPVGSVITLINANSISVNGYRIYVEPENWNSDDSPRIWVNGTNFNDYSTWSFQGIQTATLMKIGSNEWLLTCNDPTDES